MNVSRRFQVCRLRCSTSMFFSRHAARGRFHDQRKYEQQEARGHVREFKPAAPSTTSTVPEFIPETPPSVKQPHGI